MSYNTCGGSKMVTVSRAASEGRDSPGEVYSASAQHRHILRCFLHKLAQVVVQSRYGNIPASSDKAPDWEIICKEKELHHVSGLTDSEFNLDVLDNVDVAEQFDKVVENWELKPGNSFTISILIQSADGDLFVMEMWTLAMSGVAFSLTARNIDASRFYSKLAALLKSVFVATRISPGYEMSFHQSSTSFVMLYTLTTTAPNIKHLGRDYQEWSFPAICCSEGQCRLEVRFRTNYKRDLDFNCPILHRDMYYSSLASLNDAAALGNVSRSPATCRKPILPQPTRLPLRHSSDKHLDRTVEAPRGFCACSSCLGAQTRFQPSHQHQYLPQTVRQRSSATPPPLDVTRRISTGGVRRVQHDPNLSPSNTSETTCGSLPTRFVTTGPQSACRGLPRTSSPSFKALSCSPPLPMSPPTAIPQVPASEFSFAPITLNPPPDLYIVPQVQLPPDDLFASIIHQTSEDVVAHVDTSSSDSGDEQDNNTTPPEDLQQPSTVTQKRLSGADSAGLSNDADYVVVEDAALFLENKSPHSELSAFLYACKNAPHLFRTPSLVSIPDAVGSAGTSSPRSVGVATASIGSGSKLVRCGSVSSGSLVTQGDQEEFFSHGRSNCFGAVGLELHDKPELVPFEERLKQFENNLDHFNILVESIHSSCDLEQT